MSLRCPANRMLSASLVSHSAVRLGSKLSSQVISSSNMAAGLIFSCSISDAAREKENPGEKKINQQLYKCRRQRISNILIMVRFPPQCAQSVPSTKKLSPLSKRSELSCLLDTKNSPCQALTHWQVTLSLRWCNPSVKAILHLVSRSRTCLEAVIRMTSVPVHTYMWGHPITDISGQNILYTGTKVWKRYKQKKGLI